MAPMSRAEKIVVGVRPGDRARGRDRAERGGCALAPAGFDLCLQTIPLGDPPPAAAPWPHAAPPGFDAPPPGPSRAAGAIFDLTRLLGAAGRPFATGIDRFDIALAKQLYARLGDGLHFAALRGEAARAVPWTGAVRFLDALDRRWRGLRLSPGQRLALARAPILRRGRAPDLLRRRAAGGAIYVNGGHGGLLRSSAAMAMLDPDGRMPRRVILHDLIPLTHPKAQTPEGRARFARFLAGVEAAPGRTLVLANSAATAAEWDARGGPGAQVLRVALAPRAAVPAPGLVRDLLAPRLTAAPGPLFVCLGTVEPRKGHAMLLDIWEEFARFGRAAPAPRLAVVGRRGWAERGLVQRLLDPPPGVVWLDGATDAEATALLAHSDGLLMPSGAEGLGLPAMEAAALGVPALLSDLPALREAGGPSARFLPPGDHAAWAAAIHELCMHA
ncbi:glycosyltransferase [Rhodovulum sp. DZ06]|uniref:glycosyltransferase n=1 Tax=Rhodovulum sp. DZ06 TaxID=3425126 RepID=UPI003D3598E7